MNLYPFTLDDISSAENNLEVLHKNSEISLLLHKCAKERDNTVKELLREGSSTLQAKITSDDKVIEEELRNVEESDKLRLANSLGSTLSLLTKEHYASKIC